MSLKVTTEETEKELDPARVFVTASGLPAALAEVDDGAFGTTPLNLEVLDAVAAAAAASLAASKKLPPTAGRGLFPAFIIAEEAVARLGGLAGQDGGALPEGALRIQDYSTWPGLSSSQAAAAALKDCAAFLRFYRGHADSKKRLARDSESLRCVSAYFRLLANTLAALGKSEYACEIETPRLRFSGFKASLVSLEEPTQLLDVALDDIVGNQEYLDRALRLARDVAGFDLARGENPKKVRNQILFVLGSPGCGKTVTAHAVLRRFLSQCKDAGLPARARVIRRTDWASSYQNQSASRLLDIFRDEVFNAPGVCGVYWPDIDTAFSARGDSDMRQEEKANLGTLFGILDGTIGPKNGRWFLICDANTMHMDDAMVSRLSQTPLKALGPVKPEDFVKLLRTIKLRGKDRWLPISDADWLGLGRLCVDSGLSGRSVDAIAGRVLTAIEDFTEPDSYFKASFEEKRKMIDELSKPVDAAAIRAMIADHCRFEKDAQAQNEEERFQRRVDEIKMHLSAQRAALGGLVQEAGDGAKGR